MYRFLLCLQEAKQSTGNTKAPTTTQHTETATFTKSESEVDHNLSF